MAQINAVTDALKQADQLTNDGVALARQGNVDQGIRRFREALQVSPHYAKAHLNLGVALAEKGSLAEAVAAFRAAIQHHPDYHDAHYNLGNVLSQLRRSGEAIAAYRDALRIKPDHPGTLNNLGLALTQNGQPEEGAVLLRQACRVREKFLEATNNLGLALTELGDYTGAVASFEEALRIEPHHVDSHTNLGNTYKDQGRLDEALACYNLALLMRPSAPTPRWNRALVRLHKGDYERGWPEYEARRRKPDSGIRTFPQPDWDGTPLEGRAILIHMEQGLGDMLQFIRYAPLVHAQGGRVVASCPKSLAPLFARCAGLDQVVNDKEPLPPFDVQIPLLSLPGLLKTTLETVPADVPYLIPDHALVEHWRQALSRIVHLKVGIFWQGNPRHRKDRQRSIPLARFERLARVPGVCLISLQKGPGVEQLASRVRGRFAVEELGAAYDGPDRTFMDTAAVMKNLDVVITVDTSVAHLAGGLGVPTWIALPQTADWRWLLNRSDSPWYPTVRLFRQEELGRWEPVFEAMASELEKCVVGRQHAGRVPVEMGPGELLDRIAELEIKITRVTDPTVLHGLRADLAYLQAARDQRLLLWQGHHALVEELKGVHAALAKASAALADLERNGDCGPRLLELTRELRQSAERRARLREELDERLGSPDRRPPS